MEINITSVVNPKLKALVSLRKSECRRKNKLFIIEGYRELKLALSSGISVKEIYFCPECFSAKDGIELITYAKKNGVSTFRISEKAYLKISFGDRCEGLIAVACQFDSSLSHLKVSNAPFFLVVEALEKPGNLGAIMRTVDAGGVDALIVSDPFVDIYNPNVVRSSLGALFTAQIAQASNNVVLSWLRDHKVKIVCALPNAKTNYTSYDFKGACALVLGSEDKGVGEFWVDNADELVTIPMKGKVDSLNVSVAAAIIIFEAIRQRDA